MIKLAALFLVLAVGAPALAQEAPPAEMPDMSKMGPMARPVKNAAADQKELAAWFKAFEAVGEKGDVEGMADMIDFPTLMMSDSMAGKFSMIQMDRAAWVEMMKPFADPKAMEDIKMDQTVKCFLMSDDLASCEGRVKMTIGKQKSTTNNVTILTRIDGKWKAKAMMEAGWGDMPAPPAE